MKIAVLGSTGMLGSMVADYLSRDFEVLGTTRRNFDALNPDWQILDDCEWVINCIGVVPQRNLDRALMVGINSGFPTQLALNTNRVIHITTDCAYTGLKGNYTEDDNADSIDDYGFSKILGEVSLSNFYNLRCSIIGQEPEGSYSLLSWFLSQPGKAVVNGYVNHYWNGITTLAFAKICAGIIQSGIELPNCQHIVPANWLSKYKLLRTIGDTYGREDITVNPAVQGNGLIDRRLGTIRPALNAQLWKLAGYEKIPTIEELVREFSEYKVGVLTRS